MKKLLVLIDGLGDLSHEQLGGKTPLEAADTPNLDEIAKRSKLGYLYPINEDYAPESDTAIVAELGNSFEISERAEFEALGADIKIRRGDLVLRANFGTIENLNSRKIIDRRAGRTLTTKEAIQLAKAINENINLPIKFKFFPTIQHRGILVFYGGFTDNLTDTDTYVHEKGKIYVKDKFDWSQALDDEENTLFGVNLVNSFVDQSFKILDNHPINQIRKKRGLMPANIILTRDAGVEMPELNKFRNSMAITTMPLEKGIAKVSGMDVFSFDYPTMKYYDAYQNLYKALDSMIDFAIKTLKKKGDDYNFGYIHFKEIDVPGHDNKPLEKKHMIELLDLKFFSFLKNYLEKKKVSLIVTGDHSTVCKMKTHTSDPLPVLVFNFSLGDGFSFGEENSKKGSLGKTYGKDLLKKAGFL